MAAKECPREKWHCDTNLARFRKFTDLQVLSLIIALALLVQGVVFMTQTSTIEELAAANYNVMARAYFDAVSNASEENRHEVVSVLNDLHYRVHCCGVSDDSGVGNKNDPLKV